MLLHVLLYVFVGSAWSLSDYTTQWLGFSTDNGAFYYYYTEKLPNGTDATYEKTLLDLHAYAEKEQIPYKYVLLDSWWYKHGSGDGVQEWDATKATFPSGLGDFQKKTGWKFQMHNRMWSADNIYAKQNGGKYDFIMEEGNVLTIPDDQSLWDDLIANKTSVGLVTYEQDWMYNEFNSLNATLQDQGLARKWLMQMGEGAKKSNVAIQYCMEYARFILQTVEIDAVTQVRASDDYHPGQTGYVQGWRD